MPLEFDSRLKVFRVTFVGRVDLPYVLELITAMMNHPDFKAGMPAIWDANQADLSGLQYADFLRVRDFHEQHAATRGRARVAMVSAKDLAFGVGRMVGQIAEVPHLEFNVFRDMAAAEEWVVAAANP